MSSIFSDGALHPGRDANDAWWINVRRQEEWGPLMDDVVFDASRNVVELAPLPLAAADLVNSVTDADGTVYRSDPARDLVTRQRTCDAAPVDFFGGTGWATGCLRDPAGLALDDRGHLYVVDRGNHRVQVIDIATSRVVYVIEQLGDPVAIGIARSRVYVAASNGRVSIFDRGFRFDRTFEVAAPVATKTTTVIATAVDASDAILVVLAEWSRLLRFGCSGEYLGEVAWPDAPLSLAPLAGRARFELEGTVYVGPIDGGRDRLAWHEIAVDAALPPGTSIEVQTYAADPVPVVPPALSTPPPLPPGVPWAPEQPVAIPVAKLDAASGESLRPVLSDTSAWERWREAPYRRGAIAHRFYGSGPNATSTLDLPLDAARFVRENDELELSTTGATENVAITSVTSRAVTVLAQGARLLYGPGTTLALFEREGRMIDTAQIHTLSATESIDLTGISADGVFATILLPHAIAALLYPGDAFELVSGTNRVHVWIDSFDLAPATITLGTPVSADFSTSDVRVVASAGRLVVDHADGWGRGFPPGSVVAVDWDNGGMISQTSLVVVWSDPASATVITDTAPPPTWLAFSPGAQARATDRGRYLWIKLRLVGARERSTDDVASATPTIFALRAIAPRLSYLSYLPAVYSRRDADDPSGALFLERFLGMFEGRLTGVETRYEDIARMLNPLAADDEWIEFVGSWFDLVFDPSWPRARRAQLLVEIFELYRRRGTVEGLRRFVEIYTGHAPEIIEGFQVRPRAGLVLGCYGTLGCAPLGGLDEQAASATDLLAQYAHRFTIVTYVDHDCDVEVATTALRAIVDAFKPAHTIVDLRVAVPNSRIGFETMIGVDFILGDGRSTPQPLGTTTPAMPILGVGNVLGPSLRASPPLDEGGAMSVGRFDIQ